ncbi:MAG TPA: hypothetical protein VIM61_16275 [Chthoniobacterales bacterium]
MISLLIAGGVSVAANVQAVNWPIIDNHTLKGEAIPSNQVVCRNMWGTPMLPDGKGGYSLIAPINQTWIAESLMIPPQAPRGMVAYRPLPPVTATVVVPAVPEPAPAAVSAPAPVAPPAPAMEEAPAPAVEAPAEAAPADPFSSTPAGN